MENPRLRHIPTKEESRGGEVKSSYLRSTLAGYRQRHEAFSAYLRKEIGDDWVVDTPIYNPMRIIEELKNGTMSAAKACQNGCRLLAQGHHRRVHEYIIAAYRIGLDLRNEQRSLDWLAVEVINGNMSLALKVEKVEQKRLLYLFIFIFAVSGLTTRNRASHYAESLQHFYEEDRPAEEVDLLLQRHGQERLRKAATRVGAIKAIHALVEAGKASSAPSMDDALTGIEGEEPDDVVTPEEVTDYGPRGLPPDEDDTDDHFEEIENIHSSILNCCKKGDAGAEAVRPEVVVEDEAQLQPDDTLSQSDLASDDEVDLDAVIQKLHQHAARAAKLAKAIDRSSCTDSEKRRLGKMAIDLATSSSALVSTLIISD